MKTLQTAHQETFRDLGKHTGRHFERCIDRAARIEPKWHSYTKDYLVKDPNTLPDPAFITTLWTKFSDEGIESMMEKFVAQLPPESFDALQLALNSTLQPEEKLEAAFSKAVGLKPTYASLQEWCREHTIAQA